MSTVRTFPRYSERGGLYDYIRNRALATVWCTFCGKSFLHSYVTNDQRVSSISHFPTQFFIYIIILHPIYCQYFSYTAPWHIFPPMTRAYDTIWKLLRWSHDVYDPLHRPCGCLHVLPAASLLSRGAHQWFQGPQVGEVFKITAGWWLVCGWCYPVYLGLSSSMKYRYPFFC